MIRSEDFDAAVAESIMTAAWAATLRDGPPAA
jgi:hypothetical protein